MTTTPILHVVICTYNRAHILGNTLDSLADQDAPHDGTWEVLVVDNNCVDNTREVVNSYEGRLPGLAIVPEPRQGLTEARQRGFHATEAPWVGFVDDDCVLDSGWVRNAIEFVGRRPDASAFNGRNRLVFEDHKDRPWVAPAMFAGWDSGGHDEAIREGSLCGAGLVLNRQAIERSGWLENPTSADRRGRSLISGGDNELSIRAKAGGGEQWFVPQCVLDHVVEAKRLELPYLMRLNFRLGEPFPLMSLLQNRQTMKQWNQRTARACLGQFRRAFGLKEDEVFPSDGSPQARLLAFSRAVGYSSGYIKLAIKGRDALERLDGLATRERVAELNSR